MFNGMTAHKAVAGLTTVRASGILLLLPNRQHTSARRTTVRYLEDTGSSGIEPDAVPYEDRDEEQQAIDAARDADAAND
jgi:hypothetical protein